MDHSFPLDVFALTICAICSLNLCSELSSGA